MECIVSSLKAEIQDANNNFPYFGKVRIQGSNTDGYIKISGTFRITSDVVTEVMYNNTLTSLPIGITGGNLDTFKPKSGDTLDIFVEGGVTRIIGYHCKIKGNYLSLLQLPNLVDIALYGTATAEGHDADISTEMFYENTSVTTFYADNYNLEGALENLKYSALTNMQGGFNRCFGDIANLNKTGITFISMSSSQSIYGDIESFGDNLTVTDLYFSVSPNIYGDINKLAQALVANGKTSGTLKLLVNGTQCTNSYSGTLSNPLRVVITFSSGSYSMASV